MSLYVRLESSFWTHRKTLRLRSLIGDSAFWVPPRLWCYAADNQPDGNFSDFTARELALLIGYQGDAEQMLQALLQAGFMDMEKTLRNWQDHNGYHAVFRSRAKKAARARWLKERTGKEMKGKEQALLKHDASNASSIAVNGSTPTAKRNFQNGLTDSEYVARLAQDQTYAGIDVQREHGKMVNWCNAHSKTPTRRRFINWLNRAEKPMQQTKQPAPKGQAYRRLGSDEKPPEDWNEKT